MTHSQLTVRRRPLARALLAVAVTALLASCASEESSPNAEDAKGAKDTKSASPSDSPSASATPTPTASPTPTLPEPADGENVEACADGTCEIRVTGPVSVPLPASHGINPVEVTAIDAQTVTMVAWLTGSQFASDGGCSAFITGPSANVPGHVSLSCPAGEKAVVNELSVEVLGIADEAAVIRLKPAK